MVDALRRKLMISVLMVLALSWVVAQTASADVLIEQPATAITLGEPISIGYWYQDYSGGSNTLHVKISKGSRVYKRKTLHASASGWRYWRYTPQQTGTWKVKVTGAGWNTTYRVRVTA